MNLKELLEKYQVLLIENNNLKKEIENLQAQLGIPEQQVGSNEFPKQKPVLKIIEQNSSNQVISPNINNFSDPMGKIKLFMSLFKGRDDVYAYRWESNKNGKSGYSPFCLNDWRTFALHSILLGSGLRSYKNMSSAVKTIWE